MKIASWNINSIKVRKEHVKKWLQSSDIDVLLLQELKSLNFPEKEFKDIGYNSAIKAQKTYNGVAILSKNPIKIISDRLPEYEDDEQARYLEVIINNVRIINIYLPNGNPATSDKYKYKLEWMEKLYLHLKKLRKDNIDFLVGGDFNVIPENIDCYSPKDWENDALFMNDTKKQFRKLINLGLTDAFRINNNESEQYTFWDYQAGCWAQNKGIRIDHFLTSPSITDKIKSCIIDKTPRSWEKPSDHTPIILELTD